MNDATKIDVMISDASPTIEGAARVLKETYSTKDSREAMDTGLTFLPRPP